MIKKYLNRIYNSALSLNYQNVYSVVRKTGPHKTILDVGCWDGQITKVYGELAHAENIYGIEPVTEYAEKANILGIKTYPIVADGGINSWPIESNSIDCLISNQVIEHLSNLDNFFEEAARVIKPGGYIITSTNNLSSLHNIGALMCGWAPFDLSNSSSKTWSIGNPLAIHNGEELSERGNTWMHKCIYTSKWLTDWQKLYDFEYVETFGAGLYPFPSSFGKYIKKYSAFITILCQKPLKSN